MTLVVTWAWTLLYGAALVYTLANLRSARRDARAVTELNGSVRRLVTRAGVRGETMRVLTFAAYFGIGVMALLGLFPGALGPILVLASLPILANSIQDRRYRTKLLERMK